MSLISLSISRYRAVIFALVIAVIGGITSYINIPKESVPDVQIPNIYVSVRLEGISPEDSERLMVMPLEKHLRSIEGVKEVHSTAALGFASVSLEFDAGFDKDRALQDVREKVDIAKSELPLDADEPVVNEINISLFPILNVILHGNLEERSLTEIARHVKDEIEEIPNVLEAKIVGARDEVIEIIIEPEKIAVYGLSLAEVISLVQNNNKLIAAGIVDNGNSRFAVKVSRILGSIKDIEELVIKHDKNSVVKITDVAHVLFTLKDPENYAKINGKPAVVIEVQKRIGKNIIETVDSIKQKMVENADNLPPNLQVTYSQDQSKNIIDMLTSLLNNLILAVILVFFITYKFVGFRTALLVAISVPSSFLIGVVFIGIMDYTMNMVVMFSLIMAVGLLVDAATIVCEDADVRLKNGTTAPKAYLDAANRMKYAAFSSIATTLIVFIPLLFWPGTAGQFMKYIPITLIITLTASLVMAVYIIPSLGSVIGHTTRKEEHSKPTYGKYTKLYSQALDDVLKIPGIFISGAIGFLAIVYIFFAMFNNGVEFFPDVEPENALAQVRTRGNISVDNKSALVDELYKKIHNVGGIKIFYSRAGNVGGKRSKNDDVIGSIFLEFDDWQKREKADSILAKIREQSKNLGGILVSTQKAKKGPGGKNDLHLQINAVDDSTLEESGKKVSSIIGSHEAVINLKDSAQVPALEWVIDIDNNLASRYGLDASSVGGYLRMVTNGFKVEEYRNNVSVEEIDILVRFPKDRRSISELDNINITTPSGNIPLSNFITKTAKPSIATIQRVDSKRIFDIKADVKPDYIPSIVSKEVTKQIETAIKNGKILATTKINLKGEDEDQKESMVFLQSAFGVALLCMALLLVAQFNSFFAMIVIISAVFLSTVGVLIGLIITQQPFGIVMCGFGVIALSGIVVGNNIIFIDTYKQLKESGVQSREALVQTGMQRLRPILLTAGTTIIGLLPMVLGMTIDFINFDINFGSPASQWWNQLSTSIAGGLTFATILTLFFTPALILWAEKIGIEMYKKI